MMNDLQTMPIVFIKHITKKMFAEENIKTILDCSFGTGCLTLCLSELGYYVSGSGPAVTFITTAEKWPYCKNVTHRVFFVCVASCDGHTEMLKSEMRMSLRSYILLQIRNRNLKKL